MHLFWLSCQEGLLSQENERERARPYEVEKSIHLHVATTKQLPGSRVLVRWSLREQPIPDCREEKEEEVCVKPLSSVWLEKEEYPQADLQNTMYSTGMCRMEKDFRKVLFSMPKFYQYANPNLTVEREGDELLVRAEKYASSVNF